MRLIDADQVIADIKFYNNMDENTPTWRSKDVVTLLESAPTPPNDPLTLEQLREMDGKPVWVVNSPTKREEGFFDEWALVSVRRKNAESVGTIYHFENYGDHWLAYRRKPEEGKNAFT